MGGIANLQIKYNDSENWQFARLENDFDNDGLWNGDEHENDSDVLELNQHEFITGVYWHSQPLAQQAVQQIGFDIFNRVTGKTEQRKLKTYEPEEQSVNVFDTSIAFNEKQLAESDSHITEIIGIDRFNLLAGHKPFHNRSISILDQLTSPSTHGDLSKSKTGISPIMLTSPSLYKQPPKARTHRD